MKSIKNNKELTEKILSTLIMLAIATITFIFSSNFISKTTKNVIPTPTVMPVLKDPNISKQGIEKVQSNPQQQLSYDFVTVLLSQPISTPSFVTDPDRLTNYLSANSILIGISGEISKAYLYIRTGDIDIQKESVYFYIIDGSSISGHLNPTESLISDNGNEFLYDLSQLPLVQAPYSPNTKPDHKDVISTMLNHISSYNNRSYYIGGFVSTTKLPNQISSMEIRYSCVPFSPCQIYKK